MSRRSASQIVAAFTTAVQRAELDADAAKFQASIKARKQRKLEILKGGDQKSATQDSGQEEAYRKMIEHQCAIQNLYQGHFSGVTINPDQGLSDADVRKLREFYGYNRLTPQEKTHWLIKLFHEMTGLFSLMLWAGSLLCFLAYGMDPSDAATLYLGIVLAIVVFLTGLVTFFQNSQSESIMETIAQNRPQKAMVKRNGSPVEINPQEIVPGEIVIVNKGDKIPADIRMIKVFDMKVDNSALTGESDLLSRTIDCTSPDNALESKNLAFFTTNCGNGSCEGIAVLTGDRSIIGQIANLASNARAEASPLRIELDYFIQNITIIAVTLGIIFFVSGFVLGYSVIVNLVFAIGIIVANVPEGMLATITAALSISARKLALQKVIVKNLEAVETLGSTSCICSDQTGTLTQNKMTVEHIWSNNQVYKAKNKQKYPKEVDYDVNDPNLQALIDCAVVCSEANFNMNLPDDRKKDIQNLPQLSDTEQDQMIVAEETQYREELSQRLILDYPTYGDATESGLIQFFHAIEDINQIRAQYPAATDINNKESQLPFNSSNQFAYNIVQSQIKQKDLKQNQDIVTSNFCLYSKGAPERIWKKCTHILVDNQPVPIDDNWNSAFLKANQFFGGNGERVLGFASYNFPKDRFQSDFLFDMNKFNFSDNQQVFLGLVSLIDPPRDAVPYSILKCKAAGIKVIMVTGDQELTATSIAKQINIINQQTVNEIAERTGRTFDQCMGESDAIVISGDRLGQMMAEEEGLPQSQKGKKLQEYLNKSQIVFARTSPAQKLIIVEANQALGHMVAVTGDGVNDSPAIKKADIGVAMGIAGTEVTKDAADMILMNDDFSSIVTGVEQGRQIFDNLKKTIAYILTSNIPEIFPFIFFIIVSLPLAMSTVLILCVDLGTDVMPAVAIAYEQSELDIMVRKPRNQQDRLANNRLYYWSYMLNGWVQTFGCFVCFWSCFNDFGFPMKNSWFLNSVQGIMPEDTDTFDTNSAYLGNSNLKQYFPCTPGKDYLSDHGEIVDWLYFRHSNKDLRMSLVECVEDLAHGGSRFITRENVFGECLLKQVSPFTHQPVCYTTEALQYAQSSFYFGVVVTQMSNSLCIQTRQLSLFYQGMKNQMMMFGFALEILIALALANITGINIVFGTRDVIFIHFGVAAMPFAMLMNIWDEIRQFLVRNLKPVNSQKGNWFERNSQW